MSNLSRELRGLFYKHIEETNKRPNVRYSAPPGPPPPLCTPPMYNANPSKDEDEFHGVVYFYEWSDANRTPRAFYTLTAFDNFIKESNIILLGWQREIIKHLHYSYAACLKDSKELEVRGTYDALRKALEDAEKKSENNGNPFKSTGAPGFVPPQARKGSEDEPYNVRITRPKMIFETESMADEMHPEIGGAWGW